MLGIECLIGARCPLRGGVLVLAIVRRHFEIDLDIPSHETLRRWLLRVGLYVLNRPVEPADDWIWIIDHSAPVGPNKCLVVLGARRSALQAKNWTLGHHDVQVLHLEVVPHSHGELVKEQLLELAGRIGEPCQIVSDHGADLTKGIRLFREKHPEVIDTHDISHKLACLLKADLPRDDRWKAFLEGCHKVRPRLQQTPGSHLMPPETRVKARFMNYHRQVSWAERRLKSLDEPIDPRLAVKLNMTIEQTRAWIEERLGWLRGFREEIALYSAMMRVIRVAQAVVKRQGLRRDSHERFDRELSSDLPDHPRLADLLGRIREFLRAEGAKLRNDLGYLGSSDIIESLFGKHKLFAERATHKGLGPNLLLLPLLTIEFRPELVREALTSTPTEAVAAWKNREFQSQAAGPPENQSPPASPQSRHEDKQPLLAAV